MVALPLLCLLLSDMVDASMFIAAFVAGFAVQVGFKDAGKHSVEFAEQWGQLFNLSVFFAFGMAVVRDWPQFSLTLWLYALLSLTLVRMLPVAVSLAGTRLSPASLAFMGWFGPRGLASIVLGLVYLEQEMHLPGEASIRLAVMVTVWLQHLCSRTKRAAGHQLLCPQDRLACAGRAEAPGRRNKRGKNWETRDSKWL